MPRRRPNRDRTTLPPAVDLLRAWLAEHGLTQPQLAEALEVSTPTVWSWMQGRGRPICDLQTAISIATGGRVPQEAWSDSKESRRLAKRLQKLAQAA